MRRQPRASATLFVSAVVLPAAAISRLWGIDFGLPHPDCRPDEGAISAIAGGFYNGDFNPHVFNYPALFMLAVAGVLRILPGAERLLHKAMPFHFESLLDHTSGLTRHFMVARLLSAAAGIASVWIVFRAGARLFDRLAAVCAASLLALAFLHVRDSHFGVTDVPMSFMVLVAFLGAVRLSESGSRTDLILAGIASGLAASTKYNGALVALPMLFAVLSPPMAKAIPARLADAALATLLMVAAFVCTSPYTVLDFRTFLADFASNAQHLSGGHGVNLGRGWVYHATTTLRYGLGLPLLTAGIAGLLLLMIRKPRTGILVALFPVSYYAVLGGGYTVFMRHMTPMIPFLCLTAGYFVSETAGWIAAWMRRPAWRAALAGAAVIGLLVPSLNSVVRFDALIAQADSRVLARRWVDQRFSRGTTIAQLGPSSGHLFFPEEPELPYTTVEWTPTGLRPDLVVVPSSPVTGSPDLGDMQAVLKAEYSLAYTRTVVAADPRNVYDLQDEFYLPFAGFRSVERPGPNLDIHVRKDVSMRAQGALERK